MDAGFVFKALIRPDFDLGAQLVVPGVHRRADYRREPRVDQDLPAHHREHSLFLRIGRSGFAYEIQFSPAHGGLQPKSWYSSTSNASLFSRVAFLLRMSASRAFLRCFWMRAKCSRAARSRKAD